MPRRPVEHGAFVHSDRWSGGMAHFKPMGYPPITGGRWKVRKRRKATTEGKWWNARTDGQARRWNRSFHTHEEAVRWAHFVSRMYKVNKKELADVVIKEYLRSTS